MDWWSHMRLPASLSNNDSTLLLLCTVDPLCAKTHQMSEWFNHMHDGLKALHQLVYLITLKGLWHRDNVTEVL